MSEEDEMIEEFQQQKLKDEGDEDMEDYEDEDDEE